MPVGRFDDGVVAVTGIVDIGVRSRIAGETVVTATPLDAIGMRGCDDRVVGIRAGHDTVLDLLLRKHPAALESEILYCKMLVRAAEMIGDGQRLAGSLRREDQIVADAGDVEIVDRQIALEDDRVVAAIVHETD